MGLNYLRESISRSKRTKYERMSSIKMYQSIWKQRNYKSIPKNRSCIPYECVVGNLNGFQVSEIERTRWKTESKIERPIEHGTLDPSRASTDPPLRVIRVAKRYAQKRKVLSPDKHAREVSCDSDRTLLSKKIRIDTDRKSAARSGDCPKQSQVEPQTEIIVSRDVTSSKKRELDDRKRPAVAASEELANKSRSSLPAVESPTVRKRLRMLPPKAEPLVDGPPVDDPPHTEARSSTVWRSHFLQKCAELVEVRFSTPMKLTYVKPFYAQFSTCWQESKEALQLETSDLPRHEESQLALNDPEECTNAWSADETEILIRNFFQISKGYRLRHPYLIACIQTGLETRKEIYDFNQFRTAHQIIEKLCVDIPDKTSRACLVQLRTLLTPQILPYSQSEVDEVVTNLFAGFGPDWNTIAKLTGFNQMALKTTIALHHNVDLGFITPQVWFEVHQRILEANEFGSEMLGGFKRSPKRSSPGRTLRYAREATPCRILGKVVQRKRRALPSFNSIFSPF